MASLTNDVLKYKPDSWGMAYGEALSEVELDSRSTEFELVQEIICDTLLVDVDRVTRIENPYLWGCYLLKKAEYQARQICYSEVDLFHCTGVDNVDPIIRQNLDWRMTNRSKFGKGVSFSPSAKYANQYANLNIGLSRAIIMAKVLVGAECIGSESMSVPLMDSDTSIGNQSKVYVKYYDNEFYPSYVAYYDSPPIVFGRRRW